MSIENFHIFIASCYEGLDIQIPRLINNILNVNIPVNFVHFIIGGCPDDKVYYENGIEIVNLKYRCFEFTPHIYIVNNPDKYDFNYAFFTHDTVKFGKNFYNIILKDISYLKNTEFSVMKIDNSLSSMNIGLYNKNIILENKQTLLDLSVNTNDKDELMKLKHKLCLYEDFILSKNNYNNKDISINTPQQFIGKNGCVANGLLRVFERIDFIKYQSNAYTIQSIDVCKINT
jgi:hypothetical protein